MLHVLDRHAIGQILRTKEVDAWGVAANDPRLPGAPDYPIAISILMRLDPLVVRGLKHGPTLDYQQEYFRVNVALDDATGTLVDVLEVHGHRAERVQATYDKSQRRQAVPAQDGGDLGGPRLDRQDGPLRLAAVRPGGASGHRLHRPGAAGRRARRRERLRRLPRRASTRARPAAAATSSGGRAWRARSCSTPAPAATT